MKNVISMFKRVLKRDTHVQPPIHTPNIISRDQHILSRKNISPAALKVLYRLQSAGYAAYLVGGSVRDLLLGLQPKDFDVVTNALPEDIRHLFRNSIIIGRRFRLVHVRFGPETIEVATFRGNAHDTKNRVQTKQGLLLRDNVYGVSLEDDVWRRDFTMNALYYNIADFSVIDYVDGMPDIANRIIRVIGDPVERFREDPARMLRVIRLAAKLNFSVEPATAAAMHKYKNLLASIPPARLFDKMLKIFHGGKSLVTFKLLETFKLVAELFPQVATSLAENGARDFVESALANSDERINEGKHINSAFLFAVLLWYPLQQERQAYIDSGYGEAEALQTAIDDIVTAQLKNIAIPKRLTLVMKEIWHLQFPLEQPRIKRIHKLIQYTQFRAAYDFLMLRSYSQPELIEVVQWWTDFQAADYDQREVLIAKRFSKIKSRRRKRGSNNTKTNENTEIQGD